jgi:hypothetical protein
MVVKRAEVEALTKQVNYNYGYQTILNAVVRSLRSSARYRFSVTTALRSGMGQRAALLVCFCSVFGWIRLVSRGMREELGQLMGIGVC